MKHRFALLALLALFVPLLAVGCGGDDEEGSGDTTTGQASANEDIEGSVSLMGIWVATEQKSIQAVLDGFEEKYPNVDVKYNPAGDELVTVLATAVEGGKPPDIATIAQPATVREYADRGELKSLDFLEDVLLENYTESRVDVGRVDGTLYSFVFKGLNKSTVWYNVHEFENAGIEAPETWDDFLANAETLKAAGVPAYSIGGADGWTLTDLFENIYIRTAGVEKYDQLSNHEIPWTDQSVKDALAEMAKVYGDTDNIAGGTQGALQSDNPTSITQVFADPPKAAQVIEGDFVAGEILNATEAKPETDFNFFPFPSINDSPPAVVAAGDSVVMFNDTPASRALVEYLATPEAAEIWVKRGGFSSPNKNVSLDSYPDALARANADEFANADNFRFDLSDLVPSAFGATVGQGLFKLFQDFLANPDDIDGIAQKMEDAAKKAE